MITDQQAHDIIQAAWIKRGLAPLTENQIQAAMCVARFETQYGSGWKKVMAGSNNWGAIQAGKPPAKPGYSRLFMDTHPTAGGANIPYEICFREYPTPEDGASDFLRVLFVRRPSVLAAADRGSIQAVAEAMHGTGYFEGFGKTVAIRIMNYANSLWKNYESILRNTKWPAALVRADVPAQDPE